MIRMNDRKTMFVTGAVRNTGLAIAKRFASEGWNVVITSRDEASASQCCDTLKAEFPDVEFLGLGMDPADVGQIRGAFARVAEKFGRLDAFISNVAHLGVGLSVFNTTEEDWNAVMNANARGTFFCAQESARLMTDGGAMVFLSSVHANQSIPGRICYTTSKAAIDGMMRGLAMELGCKGIRVNSIIAGAIRSERWDSLTPEEEAARRGRYPAGRESFPEEIAAAAYFLCGDESKTITGVEMPVDSGISICLLPYNKNWLENDPNNVKYWEKKK